MAPNDVPSWGDLTNQAENGQLKLDDGAIADLRNACDAVVGRLIGLQGYVGRLSDLPSFCPILGSSGTLAAKFVTSANNFGDIIKTHLSIQKAMADTFTEAGKAYIRADTDSHDQLARVKALDNLPPLTTKAGTFSTDPSTIQEVTTQPGFLGFNDLKDGKIRNSNGNPNGSFVPALPQSLSGYSGDKFSGIPAEPENPDSWNYDKFRQIGEQMDYETAGNKAGLWYWMAGELDDVFTTFNNKIGAVVNGNKWSGNGASAAGAATSQYVTATDSLRSNMRLLGDNLAFTSGWLSLTKSSMPTGPDMSGKTPPAPTGPIITAPGGGPPPTSTAYPDQTPIYIENFKQTYLVGLPESDGSIAALPQPASPTTTMPTGPGPSASTPGPSVSSPGPSVPGPSVPGPSVDTAAYQKQQEAYQQQQQQKQLQQEQSQQTAAQQQEQQQQTQQEQTQQVEQLLQQGAQQGMQAFQQVAQQLSQLGTQNTSKDLADSLKNPALAGLTESALNGLGSAAGGKGAGGGGGGGGDKPGGQSSLFAREEQASSKLFPRASTTAALGDTVSGEAKAGVAAGSSGMGMPGMGAMGAAQRGQNDKERKRAEFLDSEEWLEEALGNAPTVAKPVVEK